MTTLPKSIQNLINEFGKLPGIGPKTASRLAFYLLKQPNLDLQSFAAAIGNLHKNLIYCSRCFNMAEVDPCAICADSKRNQNLICVVEDSLDVVALDQIAGFNGVYHVLGGVISPLDGVGPEKLKIQELFARLLSGPAQEVVLATNPSMEGEATAMYIAKQLKDPKFKHVKTTRLGRGLPMGADLEYADEFTLSKALEGRQEF
ncbi:MAG: recombination protein RecR [Candidatus Doudnabacteria bacterium RIFCSPLOWO2_02_FULL_49_13]|uniref:Recombination protein RecR n=1 Tax=Candidatus Doudnabacteria bacterium RIFCSPHIGHO2_12_FULL_48_16 TaxID=1817838 RepID=A0A1F5PIJ2_9BACT|nr:MAG: recombination protein RecR [Candidatus Doudnabacteria bacterium RIFCSPHIGHO2_02_FULL_49_24]OGE89012.1 MAG: recombination protein RecR [Candidatus Doudnabacteria bacterium RIFCSPHIGHO2_01_FULL_50_67]OGE89697.1 MAG: recombination protein RecR [Candidatus Doudnabacteria bacterium RIFCSPHIGHO2_12_FULL_48_16]OGE97531.1 MAG: recombination protein RecR [Candidatus Doudnabacteria bacterium RIFCSPLOWO2_01_FULL_49_40]OGF03065.1 MAG: recombination protein RecR [Candidatus Doudnabacteria bacterium 